MGSMTKKASEATRTTTGNEGGIEKRTKERGIRKNDKTALEQRVGTMNGGTRAVILYSELYRYIPRENNTPTEKLSIGLLYLDALNPFTLWRNFSRLSHPISSSFSSNKYCTLMSFFLLFILLP